VKFKGDTTLTKYILHGGRTSLVSTDNDDFFREITLGLNAPIKILLNYFSRDDDWNVLAESDKKNILKQAGNKNVTFEIADPDKLANQLKKASVMYMRGGKTLKLLESLRKTPNLGSLFKGKVIAGSSAGAYALAKYYYGNDSKKLAEGLGILNIKVYVHYSTSDVHIIEKLKNFKEDLEILVLRETKFQIIFS